MPIEWDLNRRVVIRNLGPGASKSEILALFQTIVRYGQINKVWIARNPPGFAFIEFSSRRDAICAARNLNGRRCCGSRIRVEMTAENSLSSGGGGGGRSNPSSHAAARLRSRTTEHTQTAASEQQYQQRAEVGQQRAAAISNDGPNNARFPSIVINIIGADRPSGVTHSLVNSIMRGISEKHLEGNNPATSNNSNGNTPASEHPAPSLTATCPVCMEGINRNEAQPTATRCGHIFCTSCIRRVVSRTYKCPVCNTANNVNDLVRLYL